MSCLKGRDSIRESKVATACHVLSVPATLYGFPPRSSHWNKMSRANSSPSGLDHGPCCESGQVDACGICDGNSLWVDVQMTCCATVRDESGVCCPSGYLDECHVCDGDGLTCSTLALLELAVAEDSPFEKALNKKSSISALQELSRTDFEMMFSNKVSDLLEVEAEAILISGVELVQNRSGPVGQSLYNTHKWSGLVVEFKVSSSGEERNPFVVHRRSALQVLNAAVAEHPPHALPGEHGHSSSLMVKNNSHVDEFIPGMVLTAVRGIKRQGECGNNICEIGERCTPEGTSVSATEDTEIGFLTQTSGRCCFEDCQFVLQQCPVPINGPRAGVACATNGRCLDTTGTCDCFVGHTGEDCSKCSPGWAATIDGNCVRQVDGPRHRLLRTVASESSVSSSSNEQGTIAMTGNITLRKATHEISQSMNLVPLPPGTLGRDVWMPSSLGNESTPAQTEAESKQIHNVMEQTGQSWLQAVPGPEDQPLSWLRPQPGNVVIQESFDRFRRGPEKQGEGIMMAVPRDTTGVMKNQPPLRQDLPALSASLTAEDAVAADRESTSEGQEPGSITAALGKETQMVTGQDQPMEKAFHVGSMNDPEAGLGEATEFKEHERKPSHPREKLHGFSVGLSVAAACIVLVIALLNLARKTFHGRRGMQPLSMEGEAVESVANAEGRQSSVNQDLQGSSLKGIVLEGQHDPRSPPPVQVPSWKNGKKLVSLEIHAPDSGQDENSLQVRSNDVNDQTPLAVRMKDFHSESFPVAGPTFPDETDIEERPLVQDYGAAFMPSVSSGRQPLRPSFRSLI
ncbi:hypothetical protein CBR_g9225 [Chara braunii]|uniref:EGF-like domain-containing protein n=1 Tax=Chara braunii TaxID=69332 RepID=A0A388KP49_CHABU|nr:hypothetical protein CBR_g9225 [Chara braunii]|eukprot:GBG71815.1 hypothetical protein CBR_g9225 [Chara braunii]